VNERQGASALSFTEASMEIDLQLRSLLQISQFARLRWNLSTCLWLESRTRGRTVKYIDDFADKRLEKPMSKMVIAKLSLTLASPVSGTGQNNSPNPVNQVHADSHSRTIRHREKQSPKSSEPSAHRFAFTHNPAQGNAKNCQQGITRQHKQAPARRHRVTWESASKASQGNTRKR
jgi:hypothetical protein